MFIYNQKSLAAGATLVGELAFQSTLGSLVFLFWAIREQKGFGFSILQRWLSYKWTAT